MDTVVSPTELSLSSVSLASSACSSGSARVKRRSGAGFCAWKWPFTIASGVINILGGCTGYFSPRRAYTIHTVDSLLSTKSRSEMGGMLWDSGIGDGTSSAGDNDPGNVDEKAEDGEGEWKYVRHDELNSLERYLKDESE